MKTTFASQEIPSDHCTSGIVDEGKCIKSAHHSTSQVFEDKESQSKEDKTETSLFRRIFLPSAFTFKDARSRFDKKINAAISDIGHESRNQWVAPNSVRGLSILENEGIEVDQITIQNYSGKSDLDSIDTNIIDPEIRANISTYIDTMRQSIQNVSPDEKSNGSKNTIDISVARKILNVESDGVVSMASAVVDNERSSNTSDSFDTSLDDNCISSEAQAGIGAFIDALNKDKVAKTDNHFAVDDFQYMSSDSECSDGSDSVAPETEEQLLAFIHSMERKNDGNLIHSN